MQLNVMSVGGIPSEQSSSLSYWPTGQSQIGDNSSLDRYPLCSRSKCSRIVGSTCAYGTVFFGPTRQSGL